MFSNQNQPNPFQQPNTQFGPSTVSQLSNPNSVASPFGTTSRVYDAQPVSYKNFDKPQSNSVSGTPITNIFGVPRNSEWGFESTPSIFQSNSAHGSTSSIFGVPSVTALAPESASSGFDTSMFGLPSTNNTIGSRFPLFGSTSSSVSSSLFGPQNSGVSFSTPCQNSSNSASTFLNSSSSNSSVYAIQNSGKI